MASLTTRPEYRDFLERHGLLDVERLLALPGVIICGHPRRHVLRATLGGGSDVLACFVKREHCVSWRQRWTNAWAGFGFVSHSCREARLLRDLQRAGVPCPDWIAAGEDDHGRAFLILRALDGTMELRSFLQQQTSSVRRSLARKLGETLALMHDAGFPHGDLYAKHVLVDPAKHGVYFLDWQRSRRQDHVGWRQRWHDLAALHATLADGLARTSDRWACLRAYLRTTLSIRPRRVFSRQAARWIAGAAERLLQRRQVREQRQTCLAVGDQKLIWLDGEALCVTPEFHVALQRQSHSTQPSQASSYSLGGFARAPRVSQPATLHERDIVAVPGAPRAVLVRRRTSELLRWLWSWVRGKPFASIELQQLGLIFRLQRHGIATPRLLAFGQRRSRPWRIESFLLTEPAADAVRLIDWLAAQEHPQQRRTLIREAAAVLRRLHDSGCYFHAHVSAAEQLLVNEPPGAGPSITLAGLDGVNACGRACTRRATRDLVAFATTLPRTVYSRTDALRFFLAYRQVRHLDQEGKRAALRLIAQWGETA